MSADVHSVPIVQNKKKSTNVLSRNKKLVAWLFVTPAIIFTLCLKYFPILGALYVSVFRYDIVNPPGKFAGISNYLDLIKQEFFRQAWVNTLWFLVLTLLITFFIPVIQALFLSEIIKLRKLYTTLYLIPALVPLSINVILWKFIWNPDVGIANMITKAIGLHGDYTWLSNPSTTKFCIVLPGIIGGGITVLLYLAAILGVPAEISESAQIDGCTAWKRMFYITLPNIKFLILIQFITTTILTMQLLDAPYMFAGGGPNGASTSMGVYIYNTFHESLRYDHATAAGVLLLLVVMIITVIQLKLDRQEAD